MHRVAQEGVVQGGRRGPRRGTGGARAVASSRGAGPARRAATASLSPGAGVRAGRPGLSLGRGLPHRSSGTSVEQRAGSLSGPQCVCGADPSLAQPCLGLEREAPALRKGFESLGASREDAGCLSSATMKVKVIPVLEDNYMYLVIEERTREAVAVDVAVPKRVRATCGRRGAPLGSPDNCGWSRPFPCSLISGYLAITVPRLSWVCPEVRTTSDLRFPLLGACCRTPWELIYCLRGLPYPYAPWPAWDSVYITPGALVGGGGWGRPPGPTKSP